MSLFSFEKMNLIVKNMFKRMDLMLLGGYVSEILSDVYWLMHTD